MFIDTSGLMCLFDARDHRHFSAVEHFDSTTVRLTHNYILAEFIALTIARRAPRSGTLKFVEAISSGSEVEVTWVSSDLHERAMQLLFERTDKAWSLCDAVRFIVMGDRRIMDALTTDHHFEQGGFVRLLEQ
jgi:predicted nucleic acid-binding protein